ncbi:hypothetical protein ACJX0J_033791, partial [Zea mays]
VQSNYPGDSCCLEQRGKNGYNLILTGAAFMDKDKKTKFDADNNITALILQHRYFKEQEEDLISSFRFLVASSLFDGNKWMEEYSEVSIPKEDFQATPIL